MGTSDTGAGTHASSRGSEWHRWDPHLHAPGTLFNDQFKDDEDWQGYFAALEAVDPTIEALGVTDYFTVETYKAFLERRGDRLPDLRLVFPNVELRLDTSTAGGKGVNLHLLFSPDGPEHIDEIERFLGNLTFEAFEDTFRCTLQDLRRLGRKSDPNALTDKAALKEGALQFKVNFAQLRDVWRRSEWARKNSLVAVAARSGDGTAGLQKDDAFTVFRVELEKFAQIIFASQPSAVDYWLGRKSVPLDEMYRRYNGPKPCMHGCDAHELSKVGKPDLDRYTWVKGDLNFEALRQACIEPEARVHIGSSSPGLRVAAPVLEAVELSGAPWVQEPTVELNSGLVTIIGARGSGKTALLDLLAVGSHVPRQEFATGSFVSRARRFLSGTEVSCRWKDGSSTEGRPGELQDGAFVAPRIQYLSQQFVDQLCSQDGQDDGLAAEIERIVFDAHVPEARGDSPDFAALRQARTSQLHEVRSRRVTEMADTSEAIADLRRSVESIERLRKERDAVNEQLEQQHAERESLTDGKAEDDSADPLVSVADALQKKRSRRSVLEAQKRAAEGLRTESRELLERTFPKLREELRSKYAAAFHEEEAWAAFEVTFKGDTESLIASRVASLAGEIEALDGVASPDMKELPALDQATIAQLVSEKARLEDEIASDEQEAEALRHLHDRIDRLSNQLRGLEEKLSRAASATELIPKLVATRAAAYEDAFETLAKEQGVLEELYLPLKEVLDDLGHAEASTDGQAELSRLSVRVEREVDVDSWISRGEDLLDLRKNGPFRGRGSLKRELVNGGVLTAWETASASEVAAAVGRFVERYESDIEEHSPYPDGDPEFVRWQAAVAAWLFGLEHIRVSYDITYDGVGIRQLSPGTRGIVLLMIYLTVDRADNRPLVIDQPEENLDPQSVFDELVPRFREARLRRQIIVVTHNANLVVNTDADQVIVAEAGPRTEGELPPVAYASGGLENPTIRAAVCSILEGGETAFKDRARRLRLSGVAAR